MKRRDTQKSKVYIWQHVLFDLLKDERPDLQVALPVDACQSFVDKVCGAYKVETRKVVLHRRKNGATAYYQHYNRTIALPSGWACCARTVAHEVSHAITWSLFPKHKQAHGEEFVRVFADVMAKFLNMDAELIELSLPEARLKALSFSPVPGVYQHGS